MFHSLPFFYISSLLFPPIFNLFLIFKLLYIYSFFIHSLLYFHHFSLHLFLLPSLPISLSLSKSLLAQPLLPLHVASPVSTSYIPSSITTFLYHFPIYHSPSISFSLSSFISLLRFFSLFSLFISLDINTLEFCPDTQSLFALTKITFAISSSLDFTSAGLISCSSSSFP